MKFHTFHNLVTKDYPMPKKDRQSFLGTLRAIKNDCSAAIFVVETRFGFNVKADESVHARIGDFGL